MINRNSKYNKKRINESNIKEYLLEKFSGAKEISSIKRNVIELDAFLQSNFGERNDGDCTLTSLMTMIYYHSKKTIDYNLIYTTVRSFATKHFFNSKTGTIPFFIKSIFDKSLKALNIRTLNTKAAMVKGIGFNLNTIKKAIDYKKPVAFSIFNDGRNYYCNHTITIVGYEIFKIDNKKQYTMLLAYDNWSKKLSYVDYNLVSSISSINY